MTTQLPTHARVVVIGGGIVGVSVAYHLAKRGWTDIVLLERKQLTSGTTWHAAGLVTKLRATYNMTILAAYAEECFRAVEAETGLSTGFRTDRLHPGGPDRGALDRDPARASPWAGSAASTSRSSTRPRPSGCGR